MQRKMTIREILSIGTKQLSLPCLDALIDTPSLDAALLLAEVLKTSREMLIVHGNENITEDDSEKFFKLLERRRAGECVAYILGKKEFRGLLFSVNSDVLVPRPDTEILVEAALEHIDLRERIDSQNDANTSPSRHRRLSLLDLCTGSGALAISLLNERPFLDVTATDISEKALAVAKANTESLLENKKFSRSEAENIRFIQSDLFDSICVKNNHSDDMPGKFDIIVSNPPYVPSGELATLAPEVRQEPALALDGGEDGLYFLKKIISGATEYLCPGGSLLLEAGSAQMKAIKTLLENQQYCDIKIYKDLAGRDRVISAIIQDRKAQ